MVTTEFGDAIEAMGREAGAVLMKHFRQLDGYDKKGAIDLQTIADREAEEYLVKEILSRFPDHAILGEEGGQKGNAGSDYLWIVDPLDGTTNYAHGLRLFCVSIGLTYRGEMIAGCVNACALDEMYTVEKGGGAYCNGHRLSVSNTTDLEDALVVTGFPYTRRKHLKALAGMHSSALNYTRGVLRLGAAALDFANVAAGHLEAFYEFGLKPWDMSAGALMVMEAGGRVSGLSPGEKFNLFNPRVVASNGGIHDEFVRILDEWGSGLLPQLDL